MKALPLLLGAATAVVAAVATAQAGPTAVPDAELQFGVCVSCHGAHGEGRPELGAPRVGDLEAAYIESRLEGFREAGAIGNTDDPTAQPMRAIAQGLTDAQIAGLAAFITGLDPELKSPGPPVEVGTAAWAPCAACHGADARGVPATGAPDLLYQHPDYLALQLQKYRDGVRGGPGASPHAAAMAAMAQGLDDAAIDQLVGHVAALRPPRPPVANPPVTVSEAEGLAAFADIYAVATHPRCMNCHPDGDTPYQTDDSLPHAMGVTRTSPLQGLHCSTCHAPSGVGGGQTPLPPADAIWSMPPQAMVFQHRTPAQLCAQLLDPEVNGGRGLTGLTEHVEHDHLLITSWHSGREAPPLTHAELVARFETWGAAGGPCPE